MSFVLSDRVVFPTLKFADLAPGDRFRFAYPDGQLSVDSFIKADADRFWSGLLLRSMSAADRPLVDDVVRWGGFRLTPV